jgi:hypothetical protein
LDLGSLFRAKLFALEKRERTLVMAEEEASMRREAWTRECTQRAADAEVIFKLGFWKRQFDVHEI